MPESSASSSTLEKTSPKRTTSITRVGMDPGTFKRSVLDHLLYTCARELREASVRDLYEALAHTVRDRLVHRWLATQRTYQERDVKRVYYLSSEFLTGRSLGLCLLNLGLYETAEALAAERGFDLEPGARPGGRSRAWATAAWGGWPPVSWTRWPPWSCPPWATASATTSGCSSSASRTGARSSCTTTGCRAATPGSCPASRTRTRCAWAAGPRCATTPTGASGSTGSPPAPSWGCPTTRSSSATRPTR